MIRYYCFYFNLSNDLIESYIDHFLVITPDCPMLLSYLPKFISVSDFLLAISRLALYFSVLLIVLEGSV